MRHNVLSESGEKGMPCCSNDGMSVSANCGVISAKLCVRSPANPH